MNANDIIEKCAEIADKWAKDLESAGNQFDHEGDIYRVAGGAQQIANTIRALKSSPITFTPSTGEIRIESMKGGDANEPETLPGLDKSSPGVTAGASPAEKDGGMTEEQIKRLVDRFLQWRLPKNFNPDAGISYKRPNYAPEVDATPSGTNLFDAAQATDMVRFMVEGMPASSLPAETVSEATFQIRVNDWMHACFGPEISADRTERNHRFLEEALELVQALGCTKDEAHQLVDYTFDRPLGEPEQEVGGVIVTLAALCNVNCIDMTDAGETELARVWTKIEKIRAKQAAKPKCSPLPETAGLAHADDGWRPIESGTRDAQIARGIRKAIEEVKENARRYRWTHEMAHQVHGELVGMRRILMLIDADAHKIDLRWETPPLPAPPKDGRE